MGATWQVIAEGVRSQASEITLDDLPGCTGNCLIRVAATDGINQGEDVSDQPFSKDGQPPYVNIINPDGVYPFPYGQIILFEGLVSDKEDRTIPSENMRWYSDINGLIGTGSFIGTSRLSPGLHLIRFEAEDSEGMRGFDRVGVFVVKPMPSYPQKGPTTKQPQKPSRANAS
jgi:hypothetical protein